MQFPKTPGQCTYYDLSNRRSLSSSRPAGSGKTLLACQEASLCISKRTYDRIICTRPIVAAGEDLGYLPGDMDSKMEPWTVPMMEIFEHTLSHGQLNARVSIEPLGFMRGRTFKNAFVIADEMQNSTPSQMKMLLTRIGENSKMLVLGDLAQSDLDTRNGLEDILDLINCQDLEYVDHVHMSHGDVVRHPCVAEILGLYVN
jgi:phosphate starvation-inducible protein PhoH and related proteins